MIPLFATIFSWTSENEGNLLSGALNVVTDFVPFIITIGYILVGLIVVGFVISWLKH